MLNKIPRRECNADCKGRQTEDCSVGNHYNRQGTVSQWAWWRRQKEDKLELAEDVQHWSDRQAGRCSERGWSETNRLEERDDNDKKRREKNRFMCIAWHPVTRHNEPYGQGQDRTAGRHDIEHVTEGRRKSSYAWQDPFCKHCSVPSLSPAMALMMSFWLADNIQQIWLVSHEVCSSIHSL